MRLLGKRLGRHATHQPKTSISSVLSTVQLQKSKTRRIRGSLDIQQHTCKTKFRASNRPVRWRIAKLGPVLQHSKHVCPRFAAFGHCSDRHWYSVFLMIYVSDSTGRQVAGRGELHGVQIKLTWKNPPTYGGIAGQLCSTHPIPIARVHAIAAVLQAAKNFGTWFA